ncbi:hypothetical protein MUB24_13735 [Lederbergia sp. NSJ-179]|uniref:hypothetical protein n=1 Tax=Lederbergia sp. NSJ-179 TaxID=2931402 RepID=UPI001FD10DC5|nr:hypothetical protein [Lederbergia sp. NSJ-179]MCJ7841941.1 hypothetical protein [Lederbergia sp. NSJ-179]
MDNEMIKKIKTHEIKSDEIQRQAVIDLGKQKIMEQQLSRYSLFDLFRSSIRFTRLQTWLIQFALLILTTFLITKVIYDDPAIFIIQCLTVSVIFSVIFFIDELFRSFTSGMWELEQTLKYDLRQHIVIKLLIFGLADLVFITCLAFICQGVMVISFWKIILYLLVPFNITCIVLFSLFTIWRNTLSSVVFWISSGLILMGVMFLANFFNIYEIEMKYWGAGYIFSMLLLVFIVMNMLKVKKWEAFY